MTLESRNNFASFGWEDESNPPHEPHAHEDGGQRCQAPRGEAEQEAHQETISEHGEMIEKEKHQDALVSHYLRLKKQLAMARYFSAFAFLPFINRSENHLQQRRKTVAQTGEVLNFFRGQRELQMLASLVFVVWSKFATELMSSRSWNEQREVKLKLENELKVLHDQTWHLRIDTKKGKDLTDTCRHMAGWTGDLLMEISLLHAWGWWKLWHVQEKHGQVIAKASRHTEARVMQEKMRTTEKAQKNEVIMSNIVNAAGDIGSMKFAFNAWTSLFREGKETRLKANSRQDHLKDMYELRQEMIAKLRYFYGWRAACQPFDQELDELAFCAPGKVTWSQLGCDWRRASRLDLEVLKVMEESARRWKNGIPMFKGNSPWLSPQTDAAGHRTSN